MLESGADIRHFQEMPGLADTITTRSTPIPTESLKKVYAKTHPAARGSVGE